jgi:nitrogen fixation/metabolism regulation signal transduction histidine kinase
VKLSTRVRAALALNVLIAFVSAFLALRVARALQMRENAAWAIAMLATVLVVLWSARWTVRRLLMSIQGLDDALRAFRDADFSMRLAVGDEDETAEVKRLYNDVADLLRAQRTDVYQKELLLDTILQRTPVAVLLINAADRVVYSNVAARELFAGGVRIEGQRYTPLVERLSEPVRDALTAGGDAIVTIPAEQDETFHISQRTFRLNSLEHRLILVERLTAELRRQEVAVWKKAIRVINHEINNTVAPISSLFHSARLAQEMPDRRHKLGEIHDAIDERLAFLRSFLESYAQFARLPTPRKEPVRWDEILADVRALYDFRTEGDGRAVVFVDRAQLQQVLINLVKNAHESGSDPASIVVSLQRAPDGVLVRVTDAGRGMNEDVLRQALVPFYSTKPGGTGVGLALSNEIIEAHGGRMRLQARAGGGTIVTCWLPGE